MKFLIPISLLFFCFVPTDLSAKLKTIHYSYAGNYKATLRIPSISGKLPAVIYSYDEFLDWAGGRLSLKVGYDPNTFATTFSDWGYVTLVPINTSRELNGLRGAIAYLKNHSRVDSSRIYIVAMSERSLLSLLVTETYSDINKIVLISPKTINNKGYASTVNFIRNIEKLNAEILILGTQNNKFLYTQNQENMLNLLLKYGKNAKLKTYPHKKRWFWYPENDYMDDIKLFLRDGHASTNTHKPIQLPRKIDTPKTREYFQGLL